MCAEKSLAEFQTTVFSYVVLSAQHILESWMKVGVNVDEAANSLLQAKRAIKGDFKKKSKVMNELFKQMEMIYERQAKNASARSLINEVMSMGASTKYAESLLTKARESLLNKNYSEFFEYINKAEDDAKASMDRRLKAIEDSIPAVKTIIDDAKGIGADVEEAEKLFNRADLAFKSGDHLLCVELTRRCEEKAIKAQEEQIQRAIRLRRGQIQKTSEMILGFQNIIAKAKSLNIDISKAKDLLNEVNIALQKKEYVKIVRYRRSIERTMRDFKSEIEGFARTQKKPEGGVCKKCKSKDLKFFDNGWGKCLNCEWKFQWLFPDKT
jgi:tetratricopeptide (TPR) repeat protein